MKLSMGFVLGAFLVSVALMGMHATGNGGKCTARIVEYQRLHGTLRDVQVDRVGRMERNVCVISELGGN